MNWDFDCCRGFRYIFITGASESELKIYPTSDKNNTLDNIVNIQSAWRLLKVERMD